VSEPVTLSATLKSLGVPGGGTGVGVGGTGSDASE
jgi:hypothetical protein